MRKITIKILTVLFSVITILSYECRAALELLHSASGKLLTQSHLKYTTKERQPCFRPPLHYNELLQNLGHHNKALLCTGVKIAGTGKEGDQFIAV